MLKKFSIFVVLLVISFIAISKPITTNKKIYCFTLNELLVQLTDRYGEEPMFFAITEKSPDVGVGVYINKETGTYTIIEFTKSAACVISVGNSVMYRFPKNPLSPTE